MENLTNINIIKNLLNRHGFKFSKKLGQNFLINKSICPRIAENGIGGKDIDTSRTKNEYGILEIGAGIGVLTVELAKRAKKVVSVEIDSRLIGILNETLAEYDNIKLIHSDILKLDLNGLITNEFSGLKVALCANLPYYITSPIIMTILESRLPIESLTVMVQKEAAERLCALPGTRACGAVSVAVRYFSSPEILFPVSKGSFMPAPAVESRVIKLNVHENTPENVADEKFLFSVVKAAFSQRRKTLVNPVSAFLGISKEKTALALEKASIIRTARAEELSLEQWIEFCNKIL